MSITTMEFSTGQIRTAEFMENHKSKKKIRSAKWPCPNMHLTSMYRRSSCPNLEPTNISKTGHFVRPAPDLCDQNDQNLSDLASNVNGNYQGSSSSLSESTDVL